MPKHPYADTSDPETDPEDESLGFSQKYQLSGNYVKKFKTKATSTVPTSTEDTPIEDNDDDTSTPDNNTDNATLVAKKESMMAKSEEWLRWLRQEYSHKNAADHKWPGQDSK
jgi:hypothetical protein